MYEGCAAAGFPLLVGDCETCDMDTGRLGFNDVNALARQAVDLLIPEADLTIEETPRNNAYVYPQATGGDHGLWRVMVTIAPENSAALVVDTNGSRAEVLGRLLIELAAACHGEFRGRFFPPCPENRHAAQVRVEADVVVLVCPDDEHDDLELVPALPRN